MLLGDAADVCVSQPLESTAGSQWVCVGQLICANTVTDRVDSFDLIHKQRSEVKFRVCWGSISFCGFKITVRAPTSSLC